ncbi:PREDICTED: uncharacterized protein LOC104818952 [Tarenaya hassleriana]|uniref:uncharacterized protein LOC104818952 n=1 Tax=Tarenaya hassleriana TaxID=28532 RepID=UPI00053C9AB8|nr:PREDICTED: uncharacterized protein LOC104818952 [Tarenaya hassleriana]
MVQIAKEMECNKDEAMRAKEISEKKFIAKDIAGAKKFALKAQNLYPEIEGVSQMLATFDVYTAVENKVNGESDWYGILGASQRDDYESLKRKYRKLALVLHPDKNKSIGAEGAFKHVSEAWKLLSDKEKRAAYDRRRSLWTVYQKVSVSSANSGFGNFTKSTNVKTPKNNVHKPVPTAINANGSSQAPKTGRPGLTTSSPFPAKQASSTAVPGPLKDSKPDTFWTICLRCKLQYEYPRIYVNRGMLCPNCHRLFLAVERPPPGISTRWSFSSQKQNQNPGSDDHTTWKFSRSSSAAHAAAVVHNAYEKVKKEREEAQAAARKEEYLRKKNARRRSAESESSSPVNANASKLRRVSEICGSKVTYRPSGTMGKLYGTKPDGVLQTVDMKRNCGSRAR